MSVRIKTISNDIEGAGRDRTDKYPAHQASTPSGESRQTNAILELEWEALGRKLKKPMGAASNVEVDRLQKQLKEKDEKLKQAEHRINELKKQLFALQEKQRVNNQHVAHKGGDARPQKPGQMHKPGPQPKNAPRRFHGHQQKKKGFDRN